MPRPRGLLQEAWPTLEEQHETLTALQATVGYADFVRNAQPYRGLGDEWRADGPTVEEMMAAAARRDRPTVPKVCPTVPKVRPRHVMTPRPVAVPLPLRGDSFEDWRSPFRRAALQTTPTVPSAPIRWGITPTPACTLPSAGQPIPPVPPVAPVRIPPLAPDMLATLLRGSGA